MAVDRDGNGSCSQLLGERSAAFAAVALRTRPLSTSALCVSHHRHWQIRWLLTALLLVGPFSLLASTAWANDAVVSSHLAGLRARGLFSVAEATALRQLDREDLSAEARTQWLIELAETWQQQAMYLPPQQRDEMWQQAVSSLSEPDKFTPPGQPMATVITERLIVASADLVGRQATEWLVDASLEAEGTTVREDARRRADQAVQLLDRTAERISSDAALERNGGRLSAAQRRRWAQHLRVHAAELVLAQSALLSEGAERNAAVSQAQQRLRTSLAATTDNITELRAKVAVAETVRLSGHPDRARGMLRALLTSPGFADQPWQRTAQQCLLRCDLDEGNPVAALQGLLNLRRQQPQMPGELWLLQMQALSMLEAKPGQSLSDDLSRQLREEAEVSLQRVDDQVGGVWSERCRRVWQGLILAQTYGPAVAALAQSAKVAAARGDRSAAIDGYRQAIEQADAERAGSAASDWFWDLGELLLEASDPLAAAELFTQLATRSTSTSETARADLMAAFAWGTLAQQVPTAEHEQRYEQALKQHLERFVGEPTTAEARYLLGRWREVHADLSAAIDAYAAVPIDHARGWDAAAGTGRCLAQQRLSSSTANRLDTAEALQRRTLIQQLEQSAATLLVNRTGSEPIANQPSSTASIDENSSDSTPLTLSQAGLLLSLAELSLQQPAHHTAPTRVWLQRFETYRPRIGGEDPHVAEWTALIGVSRRLQLEQFIRDGESAAARQLMVSLANDDPRGLWQLAVSLGQQLDRRPASEWGPLPELYAEMLNLLSEAAADWPVEERQQYHLARVQARAAVGDTPGMLADAERLLQQQPRLAALQRLATQLRGSRSLDAWRLALKTQRMVEAQLPPGKTDWLTTRAAIIELLIDVGEKESAAKLLRVTRLLYRSLNEDVALQERFDRLSQRLSASR
jgi:tetratricopeptide (TPR) repeat protein